MASKSTNTSTTSYHGLPDCNESHDHSLSNASVVLWPINSNGAVSPFQDRHYHLETVPEWPEGQFHVDTSGRSASATSTSYMDHSSWTRTYPSMDFSPMLANSTIAPHDLYRCNSPLAEPHPYSNDLTTHVSQTVYHSTESNALITQDHLQYFNHPQDVRSYRGTPLDDNIAEEDVEEEGEKPEPYAKLIFRCLRDAPSHELFLREIYDWFRQNTDKGKNPHEKGWQNSVRHNLSMNKDFEKVPQDLSNPSKKGTKWRLSTQALLQGGVQSTTRYRNKQPKSRGTKSRPPAPHRQASGARGGRMAAAQMRRLQLERGLQRDLGRSCYNLRSAGSIIGDMAMPGQMHVPGSPDYAINPLVVSDLSDPTSTGSSPCLSVAQTYDWPQQSQYPPTPDSLMPHAAQYQSYTASPETSVSRLRMNQDTLFLPTSNDFSGPYMLTSPVTLEGYEHLGLDPILNFNQASGSSQS